MKPFRLFFAVFVFCHLFLSCYFSDVWQRWNTTSRVLSVLAVAHYGSLQIDPFHERTEDKCFVNGHYYSEKAPLPALITIPFYFLIKSPDDIVPDENGRIGKRAYITGNILCSSLPFVFIVAVLFLKIRHYSAAVSPVLLASLPLYGSFLFVYTGAFFNHLFSGALLLAAYLFLHDKKQFFFAGLFSGLAFLSDFPLGIVLPVWCFQIWFKQKSWRSSMKFICGWMPALAFILAYNYAITGNPFKMLYQFVSHAEFIPARATLGFISLHAEALWQMLFSEFRGIFFYFSMLILILVSGLKYLTEGLIHTHKSFAHISEGIKTTGKNYLIPLAVIHYFIIASHEMWWGGWCYGPRHLIPIIVLLAFGGIRFMAQHKFSQCLFWILFFSGVFVHWMTMSTVGYNISSEYSSPFFDRVWPLFAGGYFNPNNMATLLFGIRPEYAVYGWLLFFCLSSIFLNVWYKRTLITNNTLN